MLKAAQQIRWNVRGGQFGNGSRISDQRAVGGADCRRNAGFEGGIDNCSRCVYSEKLQSIETKPPEQIRADPRNKSDLITEFREPGRADRRRTAEFQGEIFGEHLMTKTRKGAHADKNGVGVQFPRDQNLHSFRL